MIRFTYYVVAVFLLISMGACGELQTDSDSVRGTATEKLWSSAFAQAVGVQALLASYRSDGNAEHVELATKAVQPLFIPIEEGGLLFRSGKDVWFEAIPTPADNPAHLLSGHLQALLALKELADVTGDTQVRTWLQRGLDTLYRWLPRYDTGYWLRADLNPKTTALRFRFANPYGFETHPLAIDKLTLHDPVSGEMAVLDIGAETDAKDELRIAGAGWGEIETLEERRVRRLRPVATGDHDVYLKLPGEVKNNLRKRWYKLAIDYYDDRAANVVVQMRAIAPGRAFHDLRHGDLLLTGAGQWRRWIVPVRPVELGDEVVVAAARKHTAYLAALAEWDKRFEPWRLKATGYLRLAEPLVIDDTLRVEPTRQTLPQQIPMTYDRPRLPWFEEAPNTTYVLSAHLTCILTLADAARYLEDKSLHGIAYRGTAALRARLHLFDAGYWLRYDLNPKKELLLQIDELAGGDSLPIDTVILENPQTGRFVQAETERHAKLVKDGSRHSVYLALALPDHTFSDDFDVPLYRLVIRYQDVSAGQFILKIQAINEGNNLAFRPLRDGLWRTTGDQGWKEAHFLIRPQDLGGFKGLAYQAYETEQLQRLANVSNDWLFYQYAERQRYFLDAKNAGKPVIIEPGSDDATNNPSPLATKNDHHPWLEGTDRRNPLNVFRVPITQRMKALSDRLAAGTASEHEKILRFMKYIERFRVGFASAATPDATVQERIGACGTFTNTLLALATAQGMDGGRFVNLYNFPENQGHTVAEIFADGKWRLYDATYGAYYTLADDPQAMPLSFAEIRKAYRTAPATVRRVVETIRPGLKSFTGHDIYTKANPIGVIGPDKPMLFPLRLTRGEKETLTKAEFGPRFQGAKYIGAAGVNHNQRWTLANLIPGRDYVFRIEPGGLGGDIKGHDRRFWVDAKIEGAASPAVLEHQFDFASGSAEPWDIRFTASSSETVIEFTHPYRGPGYRYIYFERFGLRAVDCSKARLRC